MVPTTFDFHDKVEDRPHMIVELGLLFLELEPDFFTVEKPHEVFDCVGSAFFSYVFDDFVHQLLVLINMNYLGAQTVLVISSWNLLGSISAVSFLLRLPALHLLFL